MARAPRLIGGFAAVAGFVCFFRAGFMACLSNFEVWLPWILEKIVGSGARSFTGRVFAWKYLKAGEKIRVEYFAHANLTLMVRHLKSIFPGNKSLDFS